MVYISYPLPCYLRLELLLELVERLELLELDLVVVELVERLGVDELRLDVELLEVVVRFTGVKVLYRPEL